MTSEQVLSKSQRIFSIKSLSKEQKVLRTTAPSLQLTSTLRMPPATSHLSKGAGSHHPCNKVLTHRISPPTGWQGEKYCTYRLKTDHSIGKKGEIGRAHV